MESEGHDVPDRCAAHQSMHQGSNRVFTASLCLNTRLLHECTDSCKPPFHKANMGMYVRRVTRAGLHGTRSSFMCNSQARRNQTQLGLNAQQVPAGTRAGPHQQGPGTHHASKWGATKP